jgi:DNA-binding transcriptional MerR regulator
MDSIGLHIGEAAQWLGVSPKRLRVLEREGRVPAARRDVFGRVYSEFDLLLLKSMGVGQRPRRLKSTQEILEQAR